MRSSRYLWSSLLFLWLLLSAGGLSDHPAEEAIRGVPRRPGLELRKWSVTFYCSCAICTGPSSPQRGGKGLTATGTVPIPFYTAATGDRALLGRFLWIPHLRARVRLEDTGKPCLPGATDRDRHGDLITNPSTASIQCVARDQVDIFVGDSRWHQTALALGRRRLLGRLE